MIRLGLLQDANKSDFMDDLSAAKANNTEVDKFAEKAVDDLNPARVLRLFQKILELDLPLLDVACRPEHLLITCIAVPPVCIRPSVEMDSGAGSNEDDATTRLLAVCDMSISIRKNLDLGIASWETIMEQWDFLQVCCSPWWIRKRNPQFHALRLVSQRIRFLQMLAGHRCGV